MFIPYGTAHAATCSLSTGSGSSRRASSAISGNPALRSTSITCCLVSCTATTELSISREIAAAHTIQLPVPSSGHRTLSLTAAFLLHRQRDS